LTRSRPRIVKKYRGIERLLILTTVASPVHSSSARPTRAGRTEHRRRRRAKQDDAGREPQPLILTCPSLLTVDDLWGRRQVVLCRKSLRVTSRQCQLRRQGDCRSYRSVANGCEGFVSKWLVPPTVVLLFLPAVLKRSRDASLPIHVVSLDTDRLFDKAPEGCRASWPIFSLHAPTIDQSREIV
jgi:hypothetical protein